jgi:hypothetical protein
MKYKPTYGDKQREKQRRRKEEESAREQVADESQRQENPADRHDQRVPTEEVTTKRTAESRKRKPA